MFAVKYVDDAEIPVTMLRLITWIGRALQKHNERVAGDFYNQDGDYLGWDGVKDDKIYVVTKDKDKDLIRKNEKKGNSTSLSQVSSAVLLPSLMVRQAVGAAVERSNNPTADDKKGGFHEEGFIAGPLLEGGQEKVVVAAPGTLADPSDPNVDKATIDTTNPANPKEAGILADVTVTAHVHPKGEFVSAPNNAPGTVTIGGSVTRRSFRQEPSPDADYKFAAALPNATHIVAGARNKTVYIYNGSGVRATFPLEKFTTITARRR